MKKIGRQVLFIPSAVGNPRNGEGSFIRLKNGDIMFGYTEYIGDDNHDDANAQITAVVSRDDGENFGEKRNLFTKPENTKNIMSLSFLRMNNGDIGAFYIIKNIDGTDKIVLSRSSDEGKTFSEPESCMDCLDVQDYFVLNNDRVIRLKSGRILFAVSRHTVLEKPGEFMPGVVCFFYSDDDGKTWNKTQTELKSPFENDTAGYQEPGLYEFEDGKIWCYIRTKNGFQFKSLSSDSGITWTEPEPDYFFSSPCSPMLVKKVNNKTVAVFNPVPEHILRKPSEVWGRTPYVCAVSDDDGKTFSKEKLYYIEDDLANGYCYPGIIETKDGFLLAYYHSNGTGCCLNSQKIIKIRYSEI